MRPKIRCLIARPLHSGGFGKSRIVSLAAAYLAQRAGYVVVGPDPEDLQLLAAWERQQEGEEPFNPPRNDV